MRCTLWQAWLHKLLLIVATRLQYPADYDFARPEDREEHFLKVYRPALYKMFIKLMGLVSYRSVRRLLVGAV